MPKLKKQIFDEWCCIYYSRENNWQIIFAGAYFEGTGTESLVQKVNELTSISAFDEGTVYHIFMNSFKWIKDLFNGKDSKPLAKREHRPDGSVYYTKEVWERVWTRSNKITVKFKNFNSFAGERYSINSVTNMIDYFNCAIYKGLSPAAFKYSAGYVIKSHVFYTEKLKKTLNDYMIANHINYWANTPESMNRLIGGNKAGLLLKNIKEVYTFEGNEFDARSFYTSIMLNDKHFPTGRVEEVEGKYAKLAFKRCLEDQSELRWFKIFVPAKYADEIDPHITACCIDQHTGDIHITYHDYHSLVTDCNFLTRDYFEKILNLEGVYFQTAWCGYLHKDFRKRYAEFYKLKESLKNVDENSRTVVKQALELVYGKGLQDRSDEDIFKLQGKVAGDGSNYITPWISNHCSAAARRQLRKIIMDNIDNVKYFDTDSVHGLGLDDYINEYNAKIRAKNIAAGFDTDAGTFKKEYKENITEVVFAPKQRIVIESNGNIVSKVAGVNQATIDRYVKECGYTNIDDIIYFLEDDNLQSLKVTFYEFDLVKGFTKHEDYYKNVKELISNGTTNEIVKKENKERRNSKGSSAK